MPALAKANGTHVPPNRRPNGRFLYVFFRHARRQLFWLCSLRGRANRLAGYCFKRIAFYDALTGQKIVKNARYFLRPQKRKLRLIRRRNPSNACFISLFRILPFQDFQRNRTGQARLLTFLERKKTTTLQLHACVTDFCSRAASTGSRKTTSSLASSASFPINGPSCQPLAAGHVNTE